MEFVEIVGGSCVFLAPTNMGVYHWGDKCILIDSGFGRDNARKALKLIEGRGWRLVAVINTHCHADHCGGNRLISRRTGAEIYAPREEIPYIERPELHLRSLYGLAYPPKDATIRLLLGDNCRVNHPLELGEISIEGVKLKIVSLPGHSIAQIGIITPDNVLYAGDALFTRKTLEKYAIPFYIDPEETVNSANSLLKLGVDAVIIGHDRVIWREDLRQHVDFYVSRVEAVEEAVLNSLDMPLSTEEVVSKVARGMGVQGVMLQYLLASTTIKGHLAHLLGRGLVEAKLENFKVVWRRRKD